MLKIYLLGAPRIAKDGLDLDIGRRKAVALLAYLAATDEVHRREKLATLLWPDYDHSRAHAYLRRDLSVLNKGLGRGLLQVSREHVSLPRRDDLWLDVAIFQDLLATTQKHDHPSDVLCEDCLRDLTSAASLYRGDFLAGFTLPDSPDFDDWQFFQAQSKREALAAGLERLVAGLNAHGEFERAIRYARQWLDLDPLHEPAHRELMHTFTWAGQQAAALRQYEECVKILDAELGVTPEMKTSDLAAAIRARRLPPPPPPGLGVGEREGDIPGIRHNLPSQLTPLIGRESELSALDQMLQDPDIRLVTILGPGGIGKTRLALDAARAQLSHFSHGVFFVSLAPLNRSDFIATTIATALNFSFRGEETPLTQLMNYVEGKELLLVLDNFEHLREATVEVISLLEASTQLKVLVTTRARLNVQAEQVFPLTGLRYRKETSDVSRTITTTPAADLFVLAARRNQPEFQISPANAAAIADICRVVEGMPLGILLAAAWMELLSPADILARVSSDIEPGLDFLETEQQDMPLRHRSLRAVFDSTWDLLSVQERRIFAELSVFRGGFTMEAAQHVSGATLRELARLVEKSLLHRSAGGRFDIHELLRQYAAENLAQQEGEYARTRDRHSAYFADYLNEREEKLRRAGQLSLLREAELESENLRSAWNWAARQRHIASCGRMLDGLCCYYEFRGWWHEGEAACRLLLQKLSRAHSPEESRLLAATLTWLGLFNRLLGNPQIARLHWEECLTILKDLARSGLDTRREVATAYLHMGITHVQASEYLVAQKRYAQSLEHYRALDDRWGMGKVLEESGFLAWNMGFYQKMQQDLDASLELRQSLDHQRGAARVLNGLALLAMFRADIANSARLHHKSLAIYLDVQDQFGIANCYENLGELYVVDGRFMKGYTFLQECLAIYRDLGTRYWESFAQMYLGEAGLHMGRCVEAQQNLEEGITRARTLGYQRILGALLSRRACVEMHVGELPEARAMLEESVGIYQAIRRQSEQDEVLGILAGVHLLLGNETAAQSTLAKALDMTQGGIFFAYRLQILAPYALLLARRGELERAVETYALAHTYSLVSNSRWYQEVYETRINTAVQGLPPEVSAAAEERGRQRDLDDTIGELQREAAQWRSI